MFGGGGGEGVGGVRSHALGCLISAMLFGFCLPRSTEITVIFLQRLLPERAQQPRWESGDVALEVLRERW